MKKPVFEIIKGTVSTSKAYTHTIFFNGKVLSDEGHWYKDHYNYDAIEAVDYNEFLDVKISAVPVDFHLRMEDWKFYKEFEFVGFRRVRGGVRVEIFSINSNFKELKSEWNCVKFLKVLRKKAVARSFEPDKFNNSTSVVLEKVYKAKAGDKLQVVYDQAKKDFVKLYNVVVAELEEK